MLFSVKGLVKEVLSDRVILELTLGKDTSVSLEVFMTPKNLNSLKKAEIKEFFLRECWEKDDLVLYAFLSLEEREVFEVLRSIGGIGNRIALSLSDVGSIEELREIITKEPQKLLSKVKGLGRKRLGKLQIELAEISKKDTSLFLSEEKKELKQALLGLGFTKDEIDQILDMVPQDISLSEQIERALRLLGNKK